MKGPSIPVTIQLTGMIVRPGDTLILTTGQAVLSAEEADQVMQATKEALPGLAHVALISHADVAGVYRPGGVCGNTTTLPIGGEQTICDLSPGHDGYHQADQPGTTTPVRWLHNDPADHSEVAP